MRSKILLLLSCFVISTFTCSLIADEDAAARLVGRAVGITPLMSDLKELCDRIGGRPSGSPACVRSINWAEAKFKEAGLTSVKTESFTVPHLWLPVSASAQCISPESFPLRVVAAPYSPSTPEHAIEAKLLDVGEGNSEDFTKLGETGKGAIALVKTKEMKTLEDLFVEYLRNKSLLENAQKAGVAALLLQSTRARGLLYRHPITFGESYSPMPVATLAREQAERLSRLVQTGEVRVRLDLRNQIGPAYESKNVVADIRGRERPDEIVLIGAHLDSWELGTGAQDNGINAAMVIDIARGFRELNLVPRRTLRFVLFTGEEQGMWGSAGYVKQHAAELDQHDAVIIFDIGSGRTLGFYLNGRKELLNPINEALKKVGGLQNWNHSLEGIDGTDNFDFLLSGVPNLVANQDAGSYLPDYHAESDVLETVDEREARMNEAIASVLLWNLAEAPEKIASRQTRSEVEKLLKETKLDEQMKAFGQWDDWESGKRGVSKR